MFLKSPLLNQSARFIFLVSMYFTVVLPFNVDASELSYFRDKLKDGSLGPELVVLPVGEFEIGCDDSECYKDERPVKLVKINRQISIMTKEVTFAFYDRFAKATDNELPDDHAWGRGDRPVINVSWDDAVSYANWLSEQTGFHYRLASEAEWEYAARGGSKSIYYFGSDPLLLCSYANVADISEANYKQGKPLINCNDNIGYGTALVGQYIPNAFGLYDMHGNIREWVQDCYEDDYKSLSIDGLAREEECDDDERVLRGGAWYSFPWFLTVSSRQYQPQYQSSYSIGFRLIREL